LDEQSAAADAARLGGQTLIVFGGNLFTLVAGLPFQIYLARTLGAEQLGSYGLAEAAVTTLGGLSALGVAPTVVRFIPQHLIRGEHAHVHALMLWSTLLLLGVGGALALLIRAFVEPFLAWREINPGVAPLVSVLALTAPIGILTFLYQQILRGFQEILVMILATSVFSLALKIALTLLLLNAEWGVQGYALAVVVSGAATLGILAIAAWRLALRLPREDMAESPPFRRWTRFGLLMYTNVLVGSVVQYLDRFIVGTLLGPASVAVLMVTKQLVQLPMVLNQGFLTVVSPMFAAATAVGDVGRRQTQYHLMNDWVVRLALPLVLFIVVFSGPMLDLYGREFQQNGVPLLLLGLLATTANFGCGPLGNLLTMSGEELALLRFSVLSTILMIAGYFALIPAFGLVGVALSQLAVALFLNGITLRLANRRLGFRWWNPRYRKWIAPNCLALATYLTFRVAMGSDAGRLLETALALSLALAAGYGLAVLAAIGLGLSPDDRAVVEAVISRVSLLHRSLTARAGK